ncbi:hypothetical protein [Glaciecola sp. SC05]|uniref:hypothetical protein n=1 Tax=Glaciecola sp. SC05 TaxID=1987355 RepID=UPI003527E05A
MQSNTTRLVSAILVIFTISACGGGGGGDTPAASQNSPPRFTSPTSFTFAENESVSFTLTVSDPDSSSLTISDDAGGDGALFSVNPNTGLVMAITAGSAFDFESPQDVNSDNVYEQNVTLSDGVNRVSATVRVTITNIDEAPVFTSSSVLSLNENTTGPVITVNATDPEGSEVSNYRIVGVEKLGETVNSQRLLDAFALDPQTGVLSVVVGFDAEVEGTTDPITVQIEASDGLNVGGGAVQVNLIDIVARVTSGIRYSGADTVNQLGAYIESVGDIDQDGLEEFWISASVDSQSNENAWLVWGKTIRDDMSDGVGDMRIDQLTANQAIRFVGDNIEQNQRRSRLIARNAGDVDGDGVIDLLIGFVEERSANSVSDIEDGPIAAVIWGDRLGNAARGELNLSSLAPSDGLTLSGLSRFENLQLSVGAGDFDGDGRSDLVVGSPFKNQARVIFGSALNRGTEDVNLGTASANTVLLIQSISNAGSGPVIQQIGYHVTAIGDLDGDGYPELAISGEGLSPSLEAGVYIVASQVIGDAKAISNTLDLLSPLVAPNVVEMLGQNTSIIGISASGDIDGDGLPELVLAHQGINGSTQVASIIYGATIANALATGEDPSLVFSLASQGVMIFVEEQSFSQTVGTKISAKTMASFTGGLGDELLIGLAGDSPLGRNEAGALFLLPDTAITSLSSPSLSFAVNNLPSSLGRKLLGFTVGAQLGGLVFTADLDGDGIPDLSMSSITAQPQGQGQSLGAYFMLPGTSLLEAFEQDSASFDMAKALSNESP